MAFSGRTGSDGWGLRNRSDTLSSVHPKLGARSAARARSGESVLNATTTEIMLARTVSLRGVHAYLRASGWVRDDSSRRESADIYLRPGDDRETAIIPASEDYADYGTRIYQVAEQIARESRGSSGGGGKPFLATLRTLNRILCACASRTPALATPSG